MMDRQYVDAVRLLLAVAPVIFESPRFALKGGTAINPVVSRTSVSSARNLFTTAMELPVLAIPELYGSKLVAALDRQHPRDWFDVAAMGDRYDIEAQMVGRSRFFGDCSVVVYPVRWEKKDGSKARDKGQRGYRAMGYRVDTTQEKLC